MSERPRLAQHSIPGRRPYQEDSIHAGDLADGRLLVAVADGMGGHAAGEVASALALETLKASLEAGIELGEAFRLANQQVHAKSKEPGKQGMGTTMVAVLITGDEYLVANVGDSRGYLITGDAIKRITQDHSFVAEAIKRGQSEEEATASQWRDALTRAIGTDAHVEVDVFGPFPLQEDSAFLLCSDGLYKTLKDPDLRGIFSRSGGPKGAANNLVTAAYEKGSDDNISVVVAEFGQVPREQAQGTMPLEYQPPEPAADEPPAPEPAPEQGKGSWWQRWKK
jgi:protein phosphatase